MTTTDKAALQLRFLDGTSVTANLPSDCKLINVAKFVCKHAINNGLDKIKEGNYYHQENGIFFSTTFPKKDYKPEEVEFNSKTLKDLGFYPK
jgi:hypothetical protein